MKVATFFKSKKTILISVAVFLTLIILLYSLLRSQVSEVPLLSEQKPDNLLLLTIFIDELQQDIINKELDVFRERYPLWELEHRAVPYRELIQGLRSNNLYTQADLICIINPAAFDDSDFHAHPIPWSGGFWGFYYHRPTLSAALGEDFSPAQNLAELEELFTRFADAGLRPLALGASHGWPLSALVQHSVGLLATDASYALGEVAANRLPIDSVLLQDTLELLKEWREKGWISSTAHTEPWTQGPRELLNGQAAFALMNQQIFTPIPVNRRHEIAYMPFPGDWAIGSIIYLARLASAEDRQSVQELERFLTSAGTVDRLQRNLGQPFFGGVQDAELPSKIIPSITADPNSAYHRSLWQAARTAIWGD